VGYTNSGKSTMLNFLTRAGVMAESILFATLDPTTRRVKLPGYKTHPEVLLTDTVGFIQKLPTHLVAAFRATLEEVNEADVLIHIIDVSSPTWEKQEQAVQSVLATMGAAEKPIVRVFNKIDLLDPEDAEYLKCQAALSPNSVAVSALHGDGMQDFVAVVEEALSELLIPIEVVIPYYKGDEVRAKRSRLIYTRSYFGFSHACVCNTTVKLDS
jgi:GTPase